MTTDKFRKWDKANSTFMRVLILRNGIELTGYSKKIGMEEKRDKTDVLTNWIIRDFEQGYLNKNNTDPRITELNYSDWYHRKTSSDFELMFTLYYDTVEWHNIKYAENKKLVEFLNRFFYLSKKNATANTLRDQLYVVKRAERLDPLSVDKPRFLSLEDLNFYLNRLQNEDRFTADQLQHFYTSYKQKYFQP
ncbi:MAG: hypothetical protein O9302_03225 [Cyclobacteriaceae bacterium]|jgi:hypothetical protein|nr:hypothetical protein [Cytophagales bacterium]MCZ8327048.1 hypothetical protein [Cyclobacteriaceae bacterium]